jgi:hypothetical protein
MYTRPRGLGGFFSIFWCFVICVLNFMYIDIFGLLLGKSDFFLIFGGDIFIKKLKRIVKGEDNK